MTRRIPLALVGVGKIARDQHLPALAASDSFELIAGVDPVGRLPGLPTYAELEQALDAHPQVRAVALCTPPGVRAALAQRALRRGCHVLLEKPPCRLPQELGDLSTLALHEGVSLFAAWHSRFAAAVEAAKEFLRARTVLDVQVNWKEDHRVWHPGQDWLWRDGGFGVLDPGINALSILTQVLPAPLVFVDAELDCPQDSAMPAAASIRLKSAAAAVTLALDFRHGGEPCWDIAVATADAQLLLSEGGRRLSIDGQPIAISGPGEYVAVYARFAQLVGDGAQDADGRPLSIAQAVLQHGRRRRIDQ